MLLMVLMMVLMPIVALRGATILIVLRRGCRYDVMMQLVMMMMAGNSATQRQATTTGTWYPLSRLPVASTCYTAMLLMLRGHAVV